MCQPICVKMGSTAISRLPLMSFKQICVLALAFGSAAASADEISDLYIENRLLNLMTSVTTERYAVACDDEASQRGSYCRYLSRAVDQPPHGKDRAKIDNFIAHIFPNERFAAECQAAVDTVYELLPDRPWSDYQCDSGDDAACRQTLGHALQTQIPERIEEALVNQIQPCHYRGPGRLPVFNL